MLQLKHKEKCTAIIYECVAYQVTANSDNNEGRGRRVTLGYMMHHHDAVGLARGQGVMGSDADIHTVTVDVVVPYLRGNPNWEEARLVSGDRYVSKWSDPVEIRKQALEKLTPEEKEVLGLRD